MQSLQLRLNVYPVPEMSISPLSFVDCWSSRRLALSGLLILLTLVSLLNVQGREQYLHIFILTALRSAFL